jgi:hypothetical protein
LSYIGEEANAYYVEEVTYGQTPVTPAMLYIGIIQDAEPSLDPKNILVRGLGSRNVQSIRKTLRTVDLTLNYVPRDWDFWAYVGNDKSVSLEVFYEKAAAIISLNHKGLKINKATITGSIDEPVKIGIEGMAQDVAPGTSKIGNSYESTPAAEPIMSTDCVVKVAAVEVTRFSGFSFTVTNNLKRQPVIRSTNPHLLKALPRRHLELSGSITADFESKAEIDDIIADTSRAVAFEVGAGAQKKIFTFGNCKWKKTSEPTKIEDLVAQKLEFDALTLTES